MCFAHDQIYEGHFENSKFSGHGRLILANGDYYLGEFKDGEFHGNGRMTLAVNGKVREGTW